MRETEQREKEIERDGGREVKIVHNAIAHCTGWEGQTRRNNLCSQWTHTHRHRWKVSESMTRSGSECPVVVF